MRRIVLLDHHEWLDAGFQARSFGASADALEANVQVPGMEFDPSLHPVEIPQEEGQLAYAVAAEFEDDAAIERLQIEAKVPIRGVFSDPEIGPFETVCPEGPVGTALDVRTRLNLGPLETEGLDGHGVRVAVVDTGIDGNQVNVVGGWNPRPGVAPGTAPPDHGTMVAFDVRIAAPEAMILDYALLQSRGGQWVAFLSDGIRAFAEIMAWLLQNPGPIVVVNSWGMFSRALDAPVGNPQNYAANAAHPFNQITAALVGSGADLFFAAGNCGSTCPDSRCGPNDVGPGNSIHGANSHPDVATVAAVTINDDVLGYSAEGPGSLAHDKPDFAAFSHFEGSKVYEQDGGTSAACPVAAGVAAALRSKATVRSISPGTMKAALIESARGSDDWDAHVGWGIVDAGATLVLLP